MVIGAATGAAVNAAVKGVNFLRRPGARVPLGETPLQKVEAPGAGGDAGAAPSGSDTVEGMDIGFPEYSDGVASHTRPAHTVRYTSPADGGASTLEGAVKSNYSRFASKIPANSRSSLVSRLLDDGNYLFEATSPGKVPGSRALYQKWVTPQGETFKMIKTTFAPDGSVIHVKPKF